jgi:hypothetical protein
VTTSHFQAVTPGFFTTLRAFRFAGRDFSDADRLPTATAAIVTETFARRYFPRGDALGQQIAFNAWPSLTIVGIAGDTLPRDVDRVVYPMIYLPTQTSNGFGTPTYLVRGTRLAAEIRAAATRVDPDAVLFDATPLEDLMRAPARDAAVLRTHRDRVRGHCGAARGARTLRRAVLLRQHAQRASSESGLPSAPRPVASSPASCARRRGRCSPGSRWGWSPRTIPRDSSNRCSSACVRMTRRRLRQ